MFTIFLGLTPFIFITFLGFVFGKLKVLDLSHAKILNLFLFYIAVPALIIKLIAQNEIGQVDFKQIFSYLIMQSICGIIAYLITSKYFKRSIPESIIWALTVALSNHVTLLLPITEIYFQQNVITQVASIILMDGIILLSIIAFFLELSTKQNVNLFNFIKNLFLNPFILSIIIGLLFLLLNFLLKEKLKSSCSEFKINDSAYRLFLPNTFMNNSGDAVRAIVDWYKINLDQIFIIVDDKDLPLGKIRFRKKGSSGGHNGLKSIIEQLQTQNFKRIRIGIGSPPLLKGENNFNTISHVLGNFSLEEKSILDKVYKKVIDSLEQIDSKKEEFIINELNSFDKDQL